MILWVFVILLCLSCIAAATWDDWIEVFTFLAAISFMAILGMIPFAIAANVGIPAKTARLEARYESLTYQYENNIYDNDNDVGKRELMEDIERWNSELAYKKEIQDNFWIGIFYPDIYDNLDYIELR